MTPRFSISKLVVALCLCARCALSTPPPGDVTDVICHTDNESECYPRVFQATEAFQRVRDDQELPAGLHVRLNVWTGEKEAKLNDETEPGPAELQGLPVDQSVVLVDTPEAEPEREPVLPKGAPAYDLVGLVKEPRAGGDSGEAQLFSDAVATLKEVSALSAAAEQGRLTEALEQLEELAHDVYYGMKLAEDREASMALLCLASDGEDRRVAGAILAAALQNNPSAVAAVEKSWRDWMAAPCVAAAAGDRLGDRGFARANDEGRSLWTEAPLSAVNGLVKSQAVMDSFVASGGIAQMTDLLRDPAASEAAKRRAAYVLMDNFLGADAPPICAEADPAPCWDRLLRPLVKGYRADGAGPDHWSEELWQRVREGAPERDEL